MRFKGLDLNLLVVFDALMETRSVTRAAERIGLTQPATSAALRRLRDYFADEIVVQVGKRMHPTSFAERLHPQVQNTLRDLERAITTPTEFDPATSTRNFRIIGSDYIMVAVLVPLVERLARIAPGVRVEIILPNEHSIGELEAGRADLLVTPEPFLSPGHPSEVLFSERQVVVGWAENPVFARGLTEDDFYAAGHVSVQFGANRTPAFADSTLSRMGRARNVEVTVGSFASAPWFIEGTARLAVLHERLVRQIARRFNLVWAPMPFDFPAMNEMIQFHDSRANDPGLAWLRGEMRTVALQT